ncbi:hypothetical protein ACT453_53420, partial [Bacillus sp. D-CC]
MKKVISNVLAVTVALQVVMAPATSFASTKEFPDVPKNHWSFEAITDLTSKGVNARYINAATCSRVTTSPKPNLPLSY